MFSTADLRRSVFKIGIKQFDLALKTGASQISLAAERDFRLSLLA